MPTAATSPATVQQRLSRSPPSTSRTFSSLAASSRSGASKRSASNSSWRHAAAGAALTISRSTRLYGQPAPPCKTDRSATARAMNSAIESSSTNPAADPGGNLRAGRGTVLSRLLVVTVVAVCVVHLVGALVVAGLAAQSAERQFEDHVSTVMESRAKLMATPLWKMQYENLGSILAELAGDPAIVSATVVDDTGTVVARTGKVDAATWGGVRSAQSVYHDGNIMSVAGRFETPHPAAALSWLGVRGQGRLSLVGVRVV